METFETSSVVNESALKEIQYHALPARIKAVFGVLFLLCVLSIILGILSHSTSGIAFGIVLFCLSLIEIPIIMRHNVKITLKRMEESVHQREYHYTVSFLNEGIHILNRTSGSSNLLSYNDIANVKTSENFYILISKAGQYIPVNRAAIDSAGKKQALKGFMLSNCLGLKWES